MYQKKKKQPIHIKTYYTPKFTTSKRKMACCLPFLSFSFDKNNVFLRLRKKKNLSHEPCITGFILEMAAQLGIAERNSDDDGKHTSSISTTQNSEVVHYKH